jgi:hypothetical protein
MNSKELNILGIRNWEWIAEKYDQPNLLLGNGFSVNIAEQFNYKSLFEEFIKNADEEFSELFKMFGTTNFEIIQEYLTHSTKVNKIFDLETERIYNAIENLKNGLIKTINKVHPRFKEIDINQIDRLTKQLVDDFGDVYSLNYDMFLYHLIMHSVDLYKNKQRKMAYQDYFWGNSNSETIDFVPFQKFTHYKNVFYLHGALCYFKNNIVDYKILRKPEIELIEVIENKIREDKFPLFVSEGTSLDKLKSIERSNYLSFCLRKLKTDRKPLLVFGTSLSSNDKHIVNAICQNKRELIIAIYVGNKTESVLNREVSEFKEMFDEKCLSIDFINSNSLFNF